MAGKVLESLMKPSSVEEIIFICQKWFDKTKSWLLADLCWRLLVANIISPNLGQLLVMDKWEIWLLSSINTNLEKSENIALTDW